jgi:hypothetical protein
VKALDLTFGSNRSGGPRRRNTHISSTECARSSLQPFCARPARLHRLVDYEPSGALHQRMPDLAPLPGPFLLESLRRRPRRHLVPLTERVLGAPQGCGLCVAWLRTVPRPGGEAHSTFGAGADPEQHSIAACALGTVDIHRSARKAATRRRAAAKLVSVLS